MERILEVQGLVKSFGRKRVVDGVAFDVAPAEVVGLLGPNGAGKSTSFRMTCGLVKPDRGKVLLGGLDVTTWPLHRRAREGHMGYLAQDPSVFRKLTVEQNILGMLEMLGVGRKERHQRCEELLEQFSITRIRKSRALHLSGGERRRLEIARCLVSNPQIIMMDEPFAGIDPVTVHQIQDIIRKLQRQGIAIWITDHAAREILEIVDRCYVINSGKVLCEGPPSSIVNNPKVQEVLLRRGLVLVLVLGSWFLVLVLVLGWNRHSSHQSPKGTTPNQPRVQRSETLGPRHHGSHLWMS